MRDCTREAGPFKARDFLWNNAYAAADHLTTDKKIRPKPVWAFSEFQLKCEVNILVAFKIAVGFWWTECRQFCCQVPGRQRFFIKGEQATMESQYGGMVRDKVQIGCTLLNCILQPCNDSG